MGCDVHHTPNSCAAVPKHIEQPTRALAAVAGRKLIVLSCWSVVSNGNVTLARVLKAETFFNRSLVLARQQQAKSRELRTSMTLARLWRDRANCLSRFTAGPLKASTCSI
jgi:hypothetical protein